MNLSKLNIVIEYQTGHTDLTDHTEMLCHTDRTDRLDYYIGALFELKI